jgi:hypothetical protein
LDSLCLGLWCPAFTCRSARWFIFARLFGPADGGDGGLNLRWSTTIYFWARRGHVGSLSPRRSWFDPSGFAARFSLSALKAIHAIGPFNPFAAIHFTLHRLTVDARRLDPFATPIRRGAL